MTKEEKEAVLHCLRAMIDEELCEECPLYGTTGTDHCEKDCVRLAIEELEQKPKSEWEHDHEILKAHSDGANEVLAIIRAEIAKEAKCTMNDNRAGGLYKALQIIDKYAEEGKA